MFCPRCGLKQPAEHRFCVSCGAVLPRQLVQRRGPKVSRWFWPVPVAADDNPNSALRVSRYLEEFEIETSDGSVSIPSHHVRFSVWVEDRAVAALSLPDDEAEALAQFLLATVSSGEEGGIERAALG
jgi:hypothetical protein